MENEVSDGVESEEISDSFLCCVCLDLLYKPVVLSCGHVSCFWCTHKSMNAVFQSHCPICRHPYHHFPTICSMLHFLFLKMYPLDYKRRETQILEQEKKSEYFSPSLQFDPSSVICSTSKAEHCVNTKPVTPFQDIVSGTSKQIAIADASCAACKKLLFRPAVLNCGHVYCESCIVMEADETVRCKVCESSHPTGTLKVCLVLDGFLKEQFEKEYELRKNEVQLKFVSTPHESPNIGSPKLTKKGGFSSALPMGEHLSWWKEHASEVHFGVGCDYCGMVPIVGTRYKCKDCVEKIGFDLCEDCYSTSAKLPGRFNQHHTPEHKFETITSFRPGVLANLNHPSTSNASQNPTNGSSPTISIDFQEDA